MNNWWPIISAVISGLVLAAVVGLFKLAGGFRRDIQDVKKDQQIFMETKREFDKHAGSEHVLPRDIERIETALTKFSDKFDRWLPTLYSASKSKKVDNED